MPGIMVEHTNEKPMLTPQQTKLLDYIHDYTHDRGFPPSVRECAEACGWRSTSTVAHHLSQLEYKGYLTRHPTIPRGVTIHITKDQL